MMKKAHRLPELLGLSYCGLLKHSEIFLEVDFKKLFFGCTHLKQQAFEHLLPLDSSNSKGFVWVFFFSSSLASSIKATVQS